MVHPIPRDCPDRLSLQHQPGDPGVISTPAADSIEPTDSVSDALSSFAESQSKELIDRLIQDIESEIDSHGGTTPPKGGGGETIIEPRKNHVVGTIRRSDIEGDDDARVAVFPPESQGFHS